MKSVEIQINQIIDAVWYTTKTRVEQYFSPSQPIFCTIFPAR